MKIIFLIDTLKFAAGMERMAVNLSNSLISARPDLRIEFVVCGDSVHTAFPLNEKIPVTALGKPFSSRFAAARELRRIIDSSKPDIILNVGVAMNQITLLALVGLRKPPRVVSWEHFNLHAGSKVGYYFRLLSAYLSDKTILLTSNDIDNYPQNLRKKLEVISNFSTLDNSLPSRLDNQRALAVGRLMPQKGFDLLVSAWKEVVSEFPEWTLQIVGNGPEQDKLTRQVADAGIQNNVSFIPSTDKIDEFYREASVFLLSSRYEGFGMVLLEAKLFGLPSVSFDCPYGPRDIVRNGIDGIMVEPEDTVKFAQAVKSLLADKERMREYGRQALQDNRYSEKTIIGKWLDLLDRVTQEK